MCVYKLVVTKDVYPRAEIYIYIIACCEKVIDRVVATCTAISVYKGQTIDIYIYIYNILSCSTSVMVGRRMCDHSNEIDMTVSSVYILLTTWLFCDLP